VTISKEELIVVSPNTVYVNDISFVRAVGGFLLFGAYGYDLTLAMSSFALKTIVTRALQCNMVDPGQLLEWLQPAINKGKRANAKNEKRLSKT